MVSRKLLVGGDEFCLNLIYFLPVDTFIPGLPPNHIGILMVFAGILNVVNSLITVLWIKSKEREAQDEGGEEAAKSVIFPVFVQVVWINIAINLYAGLVEALTPFDPEGANVLYVSIIYSLVYALRHLVTEGLAFLLMQKGCGKHAAYEAGRQAIVWGIITYIFTFVSLNDAGILGKTFAVFLDFIVCIFYLILWIAPLKHLYRRPSAIFYSRFWAIYRFCAVIVNLFSFFQDTNDLSACGYIFVNLVLFAIIQPIFCYWTLLLDSRWWQGIEIFDQRRVRTESYENIRAPLIGSDFSLATAQSLADTMDRIRVQGQVKMLNFACIKIDFQQHLGAGSFSKVYRGKYRGKECAIKLIYTVDLTTDIIQRVAAEASILSSIRHPNIVNILGVSVLPPSVCLLLELCEFGSLSDIIRGYGFDWNTSHRSPLQLNRLDVLHLALGCAKGLSAVHSYDKSICHRDVKSFNFLVDSQFTVKIADLELGVLRSREGLRDPVTAPTHNPEPLTLSRSAKGPHDELMSAFSDPNYVQVEELLANWMAPDVIEHRRFQQASDVFSLGTVLWEIVSKELPFDGETQPEIRRKLLAGYKHPLPTAVQGTPLGIVIERCWERDPSHRPQASEIVEILENLLKQSFIDIIQENSPHHHTIQYIPNFVTLHDFYEAAYRKSNNFIHAGTTATSSSRRSGGNGGIMKGLYRFIMKNNPVSWLFSSQDSGGAAGDTSVDMYDEGREDSFLLNNAAAAGDATTRTSEYGNNTTTTGGTGGGNVTFQTLDTSVSVSNRSIFNFSFGRNTNNNNDNDSDHHEREESQYILPNYLSKKNMLNIIMPPAALDAIKLIKQEKYWYELESSNESWAIFTNTYPFILIHATSSWYELFNVPSSFGIDFQLLSLISLLYPEIEAMEQQSSSSNTYVMTLAQKSMFRDLRRNTSKEIISQLKKQYEDVHGILCLHLPYMSRHSRHRSGGSGHHSKGSKGLKGNVRGGGGYNASMDFRDSFDPLGVIGGEGDEEKGGEKDGDEDDDDDDLPMPTFSIDTSGRISGHNMMCSIHAYPVYPPEEAVNVDNLVASTTRHSMQDTSTPGKMPGTPSRSIADRGSSTYSPINLGGKDRPSSSRKSLGFNERLSAHDNKVAPMYFAILFNELREQDHPRPGNTNNNDASQSSSGSQYQQNRNMYQYHSTGSRKISDITASSAFIDLTSDKDENEGKGGKKKEGEDEEDQKVILQRYYSNEFDEIYDRELDSNATNLSESYGRRGDQSFWNNFLLPRFWTHINVKDDERRSTNSRLARLTNKKGIEKSKGGGDGNARRMNSIA